LSITEKIGQSATVAMVFGRDFSCWQNCLLSYRTQKSFAASLTLVLHSLPLGFGVHDTGGWGIFHVIFVSGLRGRATPWCSAHAGPSMADRSYMKHLAFLWASLGVLAGVNNFAETHLDLCGTIALPGVDGRLDHFAVDVKNQRLFVAALANNSLEIVGIREGR